MALQGATLPDAGALITKRLDTPVTPAQGVALAYFDPEAQAWISVDTTVSEDGRLLTAKVHHFSIWDDIYFGLGDLFNKRVDKPTCEGAVPRWVDDVQFFDDRNAPLLWCAGRDPKRSDVLVIKVAVNRAYGFGIRPAVKPEWAYSSLSADAGIEDLLTAGITQAIEPVDALTRLLRDAVFGLS